MLIVKTKLDVSPINGLGVFLLEKVKKGQPVWMFHPAIDLIYPASALNDTALPDSLHKILRHHGYPHQINQESVIVLGLDHDRFMNHAEQPSVLEGSDGQEVAARDMEVGEELTCDYRRFDPHYEWCAAFLRPVP